MAPQIATGPHCSTGRLRRAAAARDLPRPPALGLAAGAPTRRLAVGHRRGNHGVIETATGRVTIGAHNHEVEVIDHPALAAAGLRVSHRDLNDGTVEGLVRRGPGGIGPVPSRAPGPTDAAGLFDVALAGPAWHPRSPRPMPPRRVLIIGSGPIVIGQAAEFDYAGVQAASPSAARGSKPSS